MLKKLEKKAQLEASRIAKREKGMHKNVLMLSIILIIIFSFFAFCHLFLLFYHSFYFLYFTYFIRSILFYFILCNLFL